MLSAKADSARKLPPPRRIGAAVVLGLAIGLLPKDSAICYLLGIIGLCLPVSLPTALISTVVFSLLGPTLDSITDPIGYGLLTNPALHGVWPSVAEIPGSAWLRLTNSVVVGSIVVAGIAAIPTYFLTNWCARQLQMSFQAGPTNAVPSGPAFATELES